ncbi:MAG: glycosyltransferase family 4 protein [Balneolaceae bacterium]|nr:glycosyltransferase family 4 protein [Balneolaceae bacterium]MBO6547554.1 glycosyltransferase family 4 protein [Balneolaceae bacterium]MBO6648066.1 glycosyltransferase family 4 protein [Balneolaceae bacterium]
MQRVSMQLVEELERRDDVEIKTIIQHAPWKGIEIRTSFFLARLARKLPGIVDEFKPNVILFSSMVTASLAKITRSRVDVPMVTINHGQDVKMPIGIYQKFIPKVFDALDGVISVSKATREECIKRGMDPGKGIALPNGFDMSDFKEVPDRNEALKAIEKIFSIDLSGKHVLLTVGRQVKRKGHEWFIKEVLPKINSEVIYLAIGDGPEHENLINVRSQSYLKEKIILAGKQPDSVLKKAYSAADVFIMPNVPVSGDMEGFGIVLLEANLAATPAVASDLEGIKDVVEDGMNGYKIPIYEPEIFAEKIDEVLQNGILKLGKQSRSFVEQNFAWNKVAERYISYLQQVVENYKSSH